MVAGRRGIVDTGKFFRRAQLGRGGRKGGRGGEGRRGEGRRGGEGRREEERRRGRVCVREGEREGRSSRVSHQHAELTDIVPNSSEHLASCWK